MNKPSGVPVLLMMLLLTSGTASAQVLPIPRQPDRDAEMQQYTAEALRDYTAMLTDWRDAVQRGNARAIAGFYTDDATLRLADGVQISGRREIERYLRDHGRPGAELLMGVTDFAVGGTLGYALGRYSLRPGTAGSDQEGTYVAVLRRAGRSWKIRALVFTDPPTPQVTAPSAAGGDGDPAGESL